MAVPSRIATLHRQEPELGGAPRRGGDGCILEVRDLGVRFAERIALDGVTFDVACGERIAVVGPNGAGKTTLFRAIVGLLDRAGGTITVHGHAPGVGLCVAYVQQRRDVDWSFPISVGEVVMMGRLGEIGLFRRPAERDRDRVRAALTTVGMSEHVSRQIGELSGGQQQRMFIARALAQEAQLVLMDEPMTGLDLQSQASVIRALDALREGGVSAMVATHDLHLAATHFDRVMVLNRRLFAFGAPAHVLDADTLIEAYGGRVRLLDTEHGDLVISAREAPPRTAAHLADAACSDATPAAGPVSPRLD